jgi:hypothetical protein
MYGTELPKNEAVHVGIDQSYSGFALTFLASDGRYETRVIKFDGSGVKRLADIRGYLNAQLNRNIIDAAMEGYAFGSHMSNMLGELGGVVKLAVYDANKLDTLIIPPTSLKKYVTGKGTGVQKNQMLLYVYKKWDVEFKDDNAADSYALAHLVSGKGSLAYEKEIYNKFKDKKYRA